MRHAPGHRDQVFSFSVGAVVRIAGDHAVVLGHDLASGTTELLFAAGPVMRDSGTVAVLVLDQRQAAARLLADVTASIRPT